MKPCKGCIHEDKPFSWRDANYCYRCVRYEMEYKKDLLTDQACDLSRANQCDGCRQGLPIVSKLHRTEDGKPFSACTAHLYKTPVCGESC